MSRPTVAVFADEQLGAEIASQLISVLPGVVVRRIAHLASGDTTDVTLWIAAIDKAAMLGAIPGTAPIIAIVETGGVAGLVECMQAAERAIAVVERAAHDPDQLLELTRRALGTGTGGLAGRMRAGTSIQQRTIANAIDKENCIGEITDFAMRARFPAAQIDAISQCVDELVMNALYDAPVDARGARLFEGVSVKRRIAMLTNQQVTVEYALDGARFGVAVRDVFGRLDRATVVRHLHKGLYAEDQVERKAGGAGLGLYLMATTASALSFTVRPGTSCEAVCLFDSARSVGATQLDFVQQPAEGPPNSARSFWTPAARAARTRRATLVAAGCALVAGAVLAPPFPRSSRIALDVTPSDAQIAVDGRSLPRDAARAIEIPLARTRHITVSKPGFEATELDVRGGISGRTVHVSLAAVATVELDSDPTDAEVTIDGAPMGSTPLKLTSLTPAARVSVTFDKVGYQRVTTQLTVPARGASTRVTQPLARAADLVRVRLESTPPGAEIVKAGETPRVDHTYTPADVFLEADRPAKFTLTMRGYAPLTVDVTPRRGEDGATAGGTLVKNAP